ncbi:MAG: phage holin family protein [Rhodocyclaceae bacterium]|nr:phage holin family protein [Rhodocyclaceae bacterium]
MSVETGGEGGREGLFTALKNLLATTIAIGKTRAELLVTELEEEKYRLMSLWVKAIAAVFFLMIGVIMFLMCIAFVFWEQRVLLFGIFASVFLGGGMWLVFALRKQAAQPSKLFRASLAELEEDMTQLRRRSSRQT